MPRNDLASFLQLRVRNNIIYEYTSLRRSPETVEVAALHMWNQKYGPQVSLD